MRSHELREQFLHYFKEKKHIIVPSSSVVPNEDPTLLFTNAGMNQFKDVFLGKSKREYTRAASSQKCIRVGGKHNDLDNVGHTARHITFFEMLGNFSFGDYFKEEAITFAWEVATKIFSFHPEKIWISIYREDEEAFQIWEKIIGKKKIVRFGEEENFWSMGDTGPCGPCTELYYDRGEKYGPQKNPLEDHSGRRFLEFWNLVFMQFNREANGKMSPLPKQSVDTGAGLERILSIFHDLPTVFETDILRSVISSIEEMTKISYQRESDLAPSFHVIADHLRTLSFAIADGAEPSNIQRGYVLRKILRRATRYGRKLGLNDPFLYKLTAQVVHLMEKDYPELLSAKKRIEELVMSEEESFLRTLKRGGGILQKIIEHAEKSENKEISGEEAFKLKDTYGFPIEEILLIAKDGELTVNLEAYELLEEEAKEKSRGVKIGEKEVAEENLFEEFVKTHGTSAFLGFRNEESAASIIGIFKEGKLVDTLQKGEEGVVILDQTPFYPEKGGQVGDTGRLSHDKALFLVKECTSPFPGVIAHVGLLKEGTLFLGEPLTALIDQKRRKEIEKYHSATHLLHYALTEVLGPHIRQAGSLVAPDRLRFDFNHHKPLTSEELKQIETLVNQKIWANLPVTTYELSFDEAQKHSEIKQFFGEKYGKKVRVVDIDGFSKELCGGTHVKLTGSIGLFQIAKEGSIAKGVRRIEAVIGEAARALHYQIQEQLISLSSLLKTNPRELNSALEALLQERDHFKAQCEEVRKKGLSDLASSLMTKVEQVGKVTFLSAVIEATFQEISQIGKELLHKMGSGVLFLSTGAGEKCQILLHVSADLVKKGVSAKHLLHLIAPLIEGSGGGKEDLAQGGGKKPEALPLAFEKVRQSLLFL